MDMLKSRQKSILDAVIREYIRTARPVASRDLLSRYDFEVSSATVRGDMLDLDELGLLEQPHTSAGRVPTDHGYRFFVDHLMSQRALGERESRLLDGVFLINEADEFVREFAGALSHLSHTFSVVGLEEDSTYHKMGLAELFDEPEFLDAELVRTFGRFADTIDECIETMLDAVGPEDIHILIGSENPYKSARQYSVVLSSWEHPDGFRGVLAMVGPKRMNYSKQKAIVQKIHNS